MFFISLENYQSINVENELAWTIWTSVAQVMAKRKVGNQTGSLTPDHQKSRIDPTSSACKLSATCRWKALDESYKFASNLIPIKGLGKELWPHKVAGVRTETILELLLGSPKIKSHVDVGAAERCREHYMGEGGGFPRVWAVVNLVNPGSFVVCPSTKSILESELTNLLVGWM